MASVVRRVVWGGLLGAAGFGVAAAVAQPPAKPVTIPDPAKVVAPPPAAATVPDAIRTADPLGAMLSEAKAANGRMRDYVCVFTKQELVGGKMTAEQVAEMRVRQQPFSVYVRFAKPEATAGLEMSYVNGWRLGKMRFRPAGLRAGNLTQTVSLDDPKVTAEMRHPVTELAIGPMVDKLAAAVAREKALGNPVEVFTSDYEFAGKPVTKYDVFTRRPHALRYAYKVCVFVDKETRLPVRFEAYDQPKGGQPAGDLLEAYSFTGLKPNAGLGDSAFEL